MTPTVRVGDDDAVYIIANGDVVDIALPAGDRDLTDVELFLIACALVWKSEDAADRELAAALVENLKAFADEVTP